jgi:hypothetical protein
MQVLKPLTILHVGFATGDVFDVTGVDQTNLEPAGFQDLEERNPIDARGFHRDGTNAAGVEPVGDAMEILREGPESACRPIVSIIGNRDVNLGRADVDAGGVEIQDGW